MKVEVQLFLLYTNDSNQQFFIIIIIIINTLRKKTNFYVINSLKSLDKK